MARQSRSKLQWSRCNFTLSDDECALSGLALKNDDPLVGLFEYDEFLDCYFWSIYALDKTTRKARILCDYTGHRVVAGLATSTQCFVDYIRKHDLAIDKAKIIELARYGYRTGMFYRNDPQHEYCIDYGGDPEGSIIRITTNGGSPAIEIADDFKRGGGGPGELRVFQDHYWAWHWLKNNRKNIDNGRHMLRDYDLDCHMEPTWLDFTDEQRIMPHPTRPNLYWFAVAPQDWFAYADDGKPGYVLVLAHVQPDGQYEDCMHVYQHDRPIIGPKEYIMDLLWSNLMYFSELDTYPDIGL